MDSKGYHDQKASFGPKKAPQQYDFFEKLTFPHFFGPVLSSTTHTLQIIQNKRKKFAKKCPKKFSKFFIKKKFCCDAFLTFQNFFLFSG
jgi:hypothetical protein